MPNYQVADEGKKQNPMIGLIGFIVIVVIAAISFVLSGPIMGWLTTANFVLGASGIQVLPLAFPGDWTPIARQLAVAGGLFLILFVIGTGITFIFMTPSTSSDMSVSLDDMRREVEARKRRR